MASVNVTRKREPLDAFILSRPEVEWTTKDAVLTFQQNDSSTTQHKGVWIHQKQRPMCLVHQDDTTKIYSIMALLDGKVYQCPVGAQRIDTQDFFWYTNAQALDTDGNIVLNEKGEPKFPGNVVHIAALIPCANDASFRPDAMDHWLRVQQKQISRMMRNSHMTPPPPSFAVLREHEYVDAECRLGYSISDLERRKHLTTVNEAKTPWEVLNMAIEKHGTGLVDHIDSLCAQGCQSDGTAVSVVDNINLRIEQLHQHPSTHIPAFLAADKVKYIVSTTTASLTLMDKNAVDSLDTRRVFHQPRISFSGSSTTPFKLFDTNRVLFLSVGVWFVSSILTNFEQHVVSSHLHIMVCS